ncbi:MAG: hypothetical protein ACTSXL_05040 [Alphaproteobacteria bacterium]|nr:MAG: hypothetical protein B6I23_02115 [Rickettsiaceae bacterium 4572_127]
MKKIIPLIAISFLASNVKAVDLNSSESPLGYAPKGHGFTYLKLSNIENNDLFNRYATLKSETVYGLTDKIMLYGGVSYTDLETLVPEDRKDISSPNLGAFYRAVDSKSFKLDFHSDFVFKLNNKIDETERKQMNFGIRSSFQNENSILGFGAISKYNFKSSAIKASNDLQAYINFQHLFSDSFSTNLIFVYDFLSDETGGVPLDNKYSFIAQVNYHILPKFLIGVYGGKEFYQENNGIPQIKNSIISGVKTSYKF